LLFIAERLRELNMGILGSGILVLRCPAQGYQMVHIFYCHLEYLRQLCIFYSHLVNFTPFFGMFRQEKPGNPGPADAYTTQPRPPSPICR
jgi:hypothetical protein